MNSGRIYDSIPYSLENIQCELLSDPGRESLPLVPEYELPDVVLEQLHDLDVEAVEGKGPVAHDQVVLGVGQAVQDVLLPLDGASVGRAPLVHLQTLVTLTLFILSLGTDAL